MISYQVFLSLRFEEAGNEAGALKHALEERGISTFLWKDLPGEEGLPEIINAMSCCQLTVIMGSKKYGKNTNAGFSTSEELRFIQDEKKPFFLVKMCEIFEENETRFRLNDSISFLQWLPGASMPEDLVSTIIERLGSTNGNPRSHGFTELIENSVIKLIANDKLEWMRGNDTSEEIMSMRKLIYDSLHRISTYEEITRAETPKKQEELVRSLKELISRLKEIDEIIAKRGCFDGGSYSNSKKALPAWKIRKLARVKLQIQQCLDKINSEVVTRRPYLQLVHGDCRFFWLKYVGFDKDEIVFECNHETAENQTIETLTTTTPTITTKTTTTKENSLMNGIYETLLESNDHIDITNHGEYSKNFQITLFCRLIGKTKYFRKDCRNRRISINSFATLFDQKGLLQTLILLWNKIIHNEPDEYIVCYKIRDDELRDFWFKRILKCESSFIYMNTNIFQDELVNYVKTLKRQRFPWKDFEVMLPDISSPGGNLISLALLEEYTADYGIVGGIENYVKQKALRESSDLSLNPLVNAAKLSGNKTLRVGSTSDMRGRANTDSWSSNQSNRKSREQSSKQKTAERVLRDRLIKLVLLGPSGTGKSSFLQRICGDPFSEEVQTTIGVDFQNKLVKHNDDTHYMLQVWDTAGQERFRSITTSYYRGAQGYLVFYDISHDNNLEYLDSYFSDIEVNRDNDSDAPIFLVGNKIDACEGPLKAIAIQRQNAFAELRGIKAFQISAKTKEGVDDLVTTAVADAIEALRKQLTQNKERSLRISTDREDQSNSTRCC